jgi:TfoX N-terminal domain
MPVSAAYKTFLQDLLSDFGPVNIRNMFGGAGVYADGVMFAIVVDDTLYLKADEHLAPCRIGRFRSGSLTTQMSLWRGQGVRTQSHSPPRPRRDTEGGLLRLDALQIFDDRFYFVRAEDEDRHVRMTRHDSLGKRFGEVLDRIFAGQGPERGCLRMRAVALLADGVAARAVLPHERFAFIDEGLLGSVCRGAGDTDQSHAYCERGPDRDQRRFPDAP